MAKVAEELLDEVSEKEKIISKLHQDLAICIQDISILNKRAIEQEELIKKQEEELKEEIELRQKLFDKLQAINLVINL